MTNLQKRILTSIIILPLSIFFIVKGGYLLIFFLTFILFAGLHELLSVFKKIFIDNQKFFKNFINSYFCFG